MTTKTGLAVHLHHNWLFEWCYDYDERIRAIKATKPASEQPLRLALFQLVAEGLLPHNEQWLALQKAVVDYAKALTIFKETRDTYKKAPAAYVRERDVAEEMWAALSLATVVYLESFDADALHRQICQPDCPWDGHTIFP